MTTPIKRASVELAFRVALGFGLDDEVYVFRDGLTVSTQQDVETLLPDRDGLPILLLAAAIEGKVRTGQAVHAHEDLVASEVGEVLAKNVDDHFQTISVSEWVHVNRRVGFYELDIIKPHRADETKDAGKT